MKRIYTLYKYFCPKCNSKYTYNNKLTYTIRCDICNEGYLMPEEETLKRVVEEERYSKDDEYTD